MKRNKRVFVGFAEAFTLIEATITTATIGVLLGLLLPAVVTSKESAERRACLDTLRQLGVAMESYTSDYGGYLPAWIGSGTGDWGLAEGSHFQCAEKRDAPCSMWEVVDQFHKPDVDDQWVHTNLHAYAVYQDRLDTLPNVVGNRTGKLDFLSNFRVIAFGSRDAPDGGNYTLADNTGWPPRSWNLVDEAGNRAVNYAPHGLGHLLVGDYISDAKAYYCPSSKNMLPDAMAFAGGWSVAHWKNAGGFDKETMLYGSGWPTNAELSGEVFPRNGMIFSNYAYRGVPFWVYQPWCVSFQDKDPATKLSFTTPGLYTHIGSPLFRTRKFLGGRALISDAFSRDCVKSPYGACLDGAGKPYTVPTTLEELQKRPGMSVAGHRDAYNVLYGDNHAATYDDPEEKILWHPQHDGCYGYRPMYPNQNCGHLGGQNWVPGVSPHYDYETLENVEEDSMHWKYSSAKIWHDFDLAAGIDKF